MKKIAFVALIGLFSVVACNKGENTTYKIKYSVSGTAVTEFKITAGITEYFITTPFDGTMDTTIILQSVSPLRLDAKGDGPSLIGTIFVNDMPVLSGYDSDTDGDNKTQVTTEYLIPQY